MAEVEAIARSSLADVRAVVSNYNVTLAGELASGRELLRAAGINADLPGAVDVVDPANQELFGWVVREGLTNIVRHAHATSCAIRLSASSVEVVDDGVGSNGGGPAGPPAPGWPVCVTAWRPPAVSSTPGRGSQKAGACGCRWHRQPAPDAAQLPRRRPA